MQKLTEPGTVRTILIQAKNRQKKYEMKDIMDIMMEALDYVPYFERAAPRKEGMWSMTFEENHIGRIKEVVRNIRKNTSLEFKYVAPPGMEDAEVEATLNESQEKNENTETTTTKQGPAFAKFRTIHVARIEDDDGMDLLLELLNELRGMGVDQHVQRVSRAGDVGVPGHFNITLNTTKDKEKIEKLYKKDKEGKLKYVLIDENPDKKHVLKLDSLPEEVPTKVMEAYLSKYLIKPQLEITIKDFTEYGLGKIELGEGTVTHEGLRRILPRKIWVGPGVSARVATMIEKPWDRCKVLCSLCKEEGHKAWDCPKQTNCFRCKAKTHASADCPYCLTCRKYGHPSGAYNIGLNSKEDTSKEEVTTEPDRTGVKTINNQPKNKIQQTKPNKKLAEKSGKSRSPPVAQAVQESVNLSDTSDEEESMGGSEEEIPWKKTGTKRRQSDTSDFSSPSKPKKSDKGEYKPPRRKGKTNK